MKFKIQKIQWSLLGCRKGGFGSYCLNRTVSVLQDEKSYGGGWSYMIIM